MFNSADARRRWFGVLFLILAGGMLVWGQTVLDSTLKGFAFLIYWLVCFLFVGLAMTTALLDLRAMRRKTRDETRDLVEETFEQIESRKGNRRK